MVLILLNLWNKKDKTMDEMILRGLIREEVQNIKHEIMKAIAKEKPKNLSKGFNMLANTHMPRNEWIGFVGEKNVYYEVMIDCDDIFHIRGNGQIILHEYPLLDIISDN